MMDKTSRSTSQKQFGCCTWGKPKRRAAGHTSFFSLHSQGFIRAQVVKWLLGELIWGQNMQYNLHIWMCGPQRVKREIDGKRGVEGKQTLKSRTQIFRIKKGRNMSKPWERLTVRKENQAANQWEKRRMMNHNCRLKVLWIRLNLSARGWCGVDYKNGSVPPGSWWHDCSECVQSFLQPGLASRVWGFGSHSCFHSKGMFSPDLLYSTSLHCVMCLL